MSMVYHTIVVGLGAAGVTAASTLAKAGKKVLGLEAENRIGGRVKTVTVDGGVVEVGAEWIHGSSKNILYDLATHNNVPIIEQDFKSRAYKSDGNIGDTELINELMDFCFEVYEDRPNSVMLLGDHIKERLTEYLKEKHPNVVEDEDFVGKFLDLMNYVTCGYLGLNDWNDSTSHHEYAALGGHQYLSWHTHGYITLFDILLNTYNNGPGLPSLEIKLNKEVTEIKWPKGTAGDVEVQCKDGKKYTANHVIVTVSLGVLKDRYSHLFAPSLPKEKVDTIETMSIGVLAKVILMFDEPWWADLRPYTFAVFLWNTQDKEKISKEDWWMTKVFGCSTPMGSPNAITVWTSGDAAKLVEQLPEDVVKRKSMELLRIFLGKNSVIPEPVGMIRSDWHSNPFTRGSYSYDNLLMPENPNARSILGAPLVDAAGTPKVLFAGEATDLTHFSTVHAASDSGYREAMRLL